MESVLKNANKVIIDEQNGAGGVVPYLPLPEIAQRKPAAERSQSQ